MILFPVFGFFFNNQLFLQSFYATFRLVSLINSQCTSYTIQKQTQIIPSDWVTPICYSYQYLDFDNGNITSPGECSEVFGRQILSDKLFKFTIRIKDIGNGISIGIADAENKKEWKNSNFVTYKNSQAQRGILEPNISGIFKNGDEVSLVGISNNFQLKLQVNGQLVLLQRLEILKDKNIKWVPFLELSEKSSVKIVNFFPDFSTLSVFLGQNWFKWDFDILYELNTILSFTNFEGKKKTK